MRSNNFFFDYQNDIITKTRVHPPRNVRHTYYICVYMYIHMYTYNSVSISMDAARRTHIHTPKNPKLYCRAMCTMFILWYSENSCMVFIHGTIQSHKLHTQWYV